MDQRTVSVYQTHDATYPHLAPFHPGFSYPEYTLGALATEPNPVYDAVRACFRLAGLDAEHFCSPEWNPLGNLIHTGETVLLKPNLVKEFHPRDLLGWQYVLTHGSVIRAVADYVWKALQGCGKVIVADAPQTDSSFAKICQVIQLDSIHDFYCRKGLDFEVIDLRREEYVNQDGVVVKRFSLGGDPNGYVAYDLGASSEFADHGGGGRYYGADYDEGEVNRHHTGGKHEYLISASAIKPDVVFSLPKLKTHKKAGITVSLKNLVGINGEKNWLPHHTEASLTDPGDERPMVVTGRPLERVLVKRFCHLSLRSPRFGTWVHRQARRYGRKVFGDTEEVIRSGNWYGNDTTWRMCLDLNKIVAYGNLDGTLRPSSPDHRKRHLALVDGILGGEGRGPMNPDPVAAGLILFGINCPSVDAACAWLMGYDPERIPIVRQAFRCCHYPLADWDWQDVRVVSNRPDWNRRLPEITDEATFHFKPHFGWAGWIERTTAIEETRSDVRS